jgi:hypothetical protein
MCWIFITINCNYNSSSSEMRLTCHHTESVQIYSREGRKCCKGRRNGDGFNTTMVLVMIVLVLVMLE